MNYYFLRTLNRELTINYIPETKRVPRYVASVLWLRFMVHVTPFPTKRFVIFQESLLKFIIIIIIIIKGAAGFQSILVTDQPLRIHYSTKNFRTKRHILNITAFCI